MAHSLTNILQIILFLSSSSSLLTPSLAVPETVLAAICSQTQNQESCENILQSDPRTSLSSLSLTLISLNLTMKRASGNFDIFSQYVGNTTDPGVKDEYRKCVEMYQEMGGIIENATELSEKKRYEKITELGQLTYNCANGVPPDSPATEINEDMLLMSETASSVNSFIVGSY